MPKDNQTNSYLHLHFIVFIWGFTAVLGAKISLDALPLVWWRMTIATILIYIYILYKKTSVQLDKKTIYKLLASGTIIALHWFTFFHAIKISNVSITLACLSTGAFFTSLLEPFFYKRKIIAYEVLLGLLVILGLSLIFQVESKYTLGIITALTSAFLSASFSIINGKFASKHDASIISLYELIGGVIFFTILLLIEGDINTQFFLLSPNDLLWLFILSSFCTAYAFIASVAVMKYISPYTVMLTINLEPIYGIILAILFLGDKEKMTPQFYIGAVIILATVIINGILKYKLKKEEPTEATESVEKSK